MNGQRGFTLVELMVALAAGSLLVLTSATWLQFSGRQARSVQAALELQDVARTALDLLETEVRGAGAYGLAGPNAPWEDTIPLGSAEPALLAVGGRCIPGLAHDLLHPVQWRRWVSGTAWPLLCAASPDGRAMPESDLLTVRRALSTVTSGDRGVLWIATTPLGGRLRSDTPPASSAVATATNVPSNVRLEVSTFYVSRDATGTRNLPSLRRKRLTGGSTGPAFEDEELVPGIERLLVQLAPAPPAAGARLLTLTVSARSLRRQSTAGDGYLRLEARRLVFLRNARATPWTD
jgi:prepilin-type N-terminal cleavage/methylation domain-containing protein